MSLPKIEFKNTIFDGDGLSFFPNSSFFICVRRIAVNCCSVLRIEREAYGVIPIDHLAGFVGDKSHPFHLSGGLHFEKRAKSKKDKTKQKNGYIFLVFFFTFLFRKYHASMPKLKAERLVFILLFLLYFFGE